MIYIKWSQNIHVRASDTKIRNISDIKFIVSIDGYVMSHSLILCLVAPSAFRDMHGRLLHPHMRTVYMIWYAAGRMLLMVSLLNVVGLRCKHLPFLGRWFVSINVTVMLILFYFIFKSLVWWTGITNGIDDVEWDPSSDKHIGYHYSVEDLSGKVKSVLSCKIWYESIKVILHLVQLLPKCRPNARLLCWRNSVCLLGLKSHW